MFLALNGGAALLALVLAVAFGFGSRPGRLLFAGLSGYLALVHSITLLTGLVGHLTVLGVAVVLGLALTPAVVLASRAPRARERSVEEGSVTVAALFTTSAAIVSLVAWAWPHLFQATRLWVWDDYTYHMVYPARWLADGAITAATPAQAFTMQAWYPLSASVVSAWFMLPFHGVRADALAWVSLTGVLYAGIVAAGAAELLARLGCARGAWAVPAVLFVTSDRIGVMASSFSDADLAQAAALFGAFVFAVPRGDAESRRDVTVDTCYAALLSGIALGVKVSAAPHALIILFMTALRAGAPARSASTRSLPAYVEGRHGFAGAPPSVGGVGAISGPPCKSIGLGGPVARPPMSARVSAAARSALVFAVAWAATAGYWYARNVVHMGNPVYPAAFLFWPGATFPETTLVEYGRRYGVRRVVTDALTVYMSWPFLHALLAVIGLAGLAAWLMLRRRSTARPRRYFACGALAITAAILTLLPAAPYSAGNEMTFRSGFIHWDSMRYVAFLPILGWTALGFLVGAGAGARASRWRIVAAVVITTVAVLTSGNALVLSGMVLIALAIGAALFARLLRPIMTWKLRTERHAALAIGVGALALAVVIAGTHGAKAAATRTALYREPLFGAAAAVLDRQPPGTRVAVFGDQWIYPTFGDHTHLRPVRLDRDGRIATAPIADAMEPGELTVDPPTFRANLRASSVDVVVVVRQPHPGRPSNFPTQHTALEASSDARLLHRDRVAIWRLD